MKVHCQRCGCARRVVGGKIVSSRANRECKAEGILVEIAGTQRLVEGECEVCSSSLLHPIIVKAQGHRWEGTLQRQLAHSV
jgi:hypothetical protein